MLISNNIGKGNLVIFVRTSKNTLLFVLNMLCFFFLFGGGGDDVYMAVSKKV